MSAPVGNQFWKARSSHGRTPIFATAEQLQQACEEYFDWVEANPLYEAKAFAYQGSVVVENVPKMRAMTVRGLCVFLDIHHSTWADYGRRPGFSAVVAKVEEIIYEQKFTGAAADLLNSNIIARDLGLAEKSSVEHGVTGEVAELMKAIDGRTRGLPNGG